MYVHLGGETVVDAREVVVILDTRTMRTAEARAVLARARVPRGTPAPRAVVVTTRGVYPAPATAATVARRVADAGNIRTAKWRKDRRDGGFPR